LQRQHTPPTFLKMAADIYSNYYIQTAFGGWSPCIQGNNEYGLRPSPGSVLPNCVGYTVGRFNEKLNEGACTWLGSVAAKDMLALAQSQGLSTGDALHVGGVICWDSAEDGHCCIIERIIDDNNIAVSESGWNIQALPIVREYTMTRTGGTWDYGSGYTYQGIIYPPRNLDGLPAWLLASLYRRIY